MAINNKFNEDVILAKVKSVVLTKKEDSEEIFVAEVDWNRVYTEQKLFDSIKELT